MVEPAAGRSAVPQYSLGKILLVWAVRRSRWGFWDGHQETGDLRWRTIRFRLWLNPPRSPQTGEFRSRLWWWLVTIAVLTAVYQLQVRGVADRLWVSVFPILAEPPGFDLGSVLNTPEGKARLVGNWGVLLLFVVNALFNTVLGEELVFRGLLLPRMAGVWALFFALPTRQFQSSWFGIFAHSGQSIYFTFLTLELVLGLG